MSSVTDSSTTQTPDTGQVTRPTGGQKRFLWILLVAVCILLLIGIIPRIARRQRAADQVHAAENRIAAVSAVKAAPTASKSDLILPANMLAVTVASIYARSSGYVKERYVDIGSKVKAGQLLAVIETPEVDQEYEQATANAAQSRAALSQAQANVAQSEAAYNQAKANLTEAQANEHISGITNTRWQVLVAKGVIPRQSGDERRSDFDARQAAVVAAQAAVETGQATINAQKASLTAAHAAVEAQDANVRRIEHVRSFERVLAPFSGVITERKIEKGDLITAGSGSDRNLFSVAEPSLLRIQVNVPQTYSIDIKKGDRADVLVQELPGETFDGQVMRTANSLDPAARTLLTEVYVDNKAGRLLPGMYSQVKFHVSQSRLVQIVPTDALIVNAQGMHMATVTPDKKIHFVTVEVGRDMGATIEVTGGLSEGAVVVSNPPDGLEEGQTVQAEVRPSEARS